MANFDILSFNFIPPTAGSSSSSSEAQQKKAAATNLPRLYHDVNTNRPKEDWDYEEQYTSGVLLISRYLVSMSGVGDTVALLISP